MNMKKENIKVNTIIKKRRVLKGVVVSDKMDKTVVVRVDRLKMNKKYQKRYKVSKRYKAHDEGNKLVEGDKVLITENSPISREKRWVASKAE